MHQEFRHRTIAIAFICILSAEIHAQTVTISNLTFTDFSPNPISPGAHPDLIKYGYNYVKSGTGTVNVNFPIAVSLSSNAMFGDSDDVQLGTFTASASLSNPSGHVSGTAFPFVLSGVVVPATTALGQYNAFLALGETNPLTDQLPGNVTVGVPALGDFNGDGDYDAADYVVWRKNNGTPAEYSSWQTNFGSFDPGSGASAETNESSAAPEPCATTLYILAMVCAMVHARRWS